MVRRAGFLLFALACLIRAEALSAQRSASSHQNSERKIIGGKVYYPGNKPAENVTVELHSTEGSFMAPATTSASGGFEFYNLSTGTYALAIDQSGYQPVQIPVDLTLTSNRGIVVYLQPLTKNSPNPRATDKSVSAHELSMPIKARDLMLSGKKKLYIDKDAQGGLADFQQATEIAPDYYEADYQIALAYLALGNASHAEKSFRKSIDVSHDSYGEANVGLGKVLLDNGDIPAAEKVLLRGVELSPTSSRGFYELGRAQLTEKKLQEAEKSADKSRSLSPDFPMVYRLLSNIHLQEKNYAALAADLDAYIKLDPDSPAGQRAKQMREQLQGQLAKQDN